MNFRMIGILLAFGSSLWCPCLPAAESSVSPAVVAQLVAAASTYESGQSLACLRRIESLVARSVADPASRQVVEAGLIQLAAANSTYEAKRFACQQLAIIGSDNCLPALAKLLDTPDTVGIACLALSTHPSAKAAGILRHAASLARGPALVQIVNTLGDRQDPTAVKLLSELTGNPDPAVAAVAVASLGKVGNRAAGRILAALRNQAKPALSGVVAEALLRCADKQAVTGNRSQAISIYEGLLRPSEPDHVRRGALQAVLRLDRDQGEQRILSILHGTDTVLKPVAIAGITVMSAPGASARFGRELPSLPAPEQAWLIQALAARRDQAAQAAVGNALDSADAMVRIAAITALGNLANPACTPWLTKAMIQAKSPEEQRAVEIALITVGRDEKADLTIINGLVNAPADVKIRLMAVLAKRGNRIALPALLGETDQANPAVAKAAFQAAGKLAVADDLPVLLDKLAQVRSAEIRSEAEGAAVLALDKLSDLDRRSKMVCAQLAKAGDAATKCSFLRLLPHCRTASALTALKNAGDSPDLRLRDAAVRSLADWPDSAAWDCLAGFYRQSQVESYRALALRGLVRLLGEENAHPGAEVTDHYRQLLTAAKSDDDYKLILGAISGFAHPDALGLVLPLLSNPGVHAEAELAVQKIAEAIKAQHPQAAQDALRRLKDSKP